MGDNEKRKRGRRPNIKLAPDRLRKAIEEKKRKDKTFRQYRLGTQVARKKDKDAAGQWVSKLLRGEVGVDRDQLETISALLGVPKWYLVDSFQYSEDEDLSDWLIDWDEKKIREEDAKRDCKTILSDVLARAGYTFIGHGFAASDSVLDGATLAIFENRNGKRYTIPTGDLRKMEDMIIDFCDSMIRNHMGDISEYFPVTYNKKVPEKSDTSQHAFLGP